jgi:hypothetical protein
LDEREVGLFGLIWVFGWAVLLVVVWHLRASRRERRIELIHKERMAALEKGSPPPELPDYREALRDSGPSEWVASLRVNPRWPLGVGALVAMSGLGVALALRLSGDAYHREVWPFGLIGVFVGVGLVLHYLLTRPRG